MPKVLIMTKKFAEVSRDPIKVLEEAGFAVEEKDYDRFSSAREDEVCRVIQGADVLIVTAMFPATRKVIESADRLKMIAIRSAGLSREASCAMAMETVQRVITVFEGKVPENVLNPEVLKSLEHERIPC